MSWVRWRLQEYTQKQNEKRQSETPLDEDEKKAEENGEPKEVFELPPALPVEGEVSMIFEFFEKIF